MAKFDETINEMKSHIDKLEENLASKSEILDDETKQKAKELVDKAEVAINTAIDKVSSAIEEIKDNEKLDDLLDKMKAKSLEAVDYTIEKIDALTNKTSTFDIDALHDEIMDEFEKLKENEAFKKTTVLIKEGAAKINEFFEKPEVKETINKAKATTINIAEKGVEGLKKILEDKPENTEDNQDNNQ